MARHKVSCAGDGEAVRIGRGYDNDVIVDDPFVAARHVRIVRDAGGALVAEDLGSANGLFAGQDRRRVARTVLDGTGLIRIGRSRLRIRELDHAVEPERVVQRRMPLWPAILVVAAALLGGEALTMWLRETSEQKLGEYLGPLLMTGVAVGVWTSAWAVMSRIFSGRARFDRHLLIATSGVLCLLLLTEITSYGAFAFSQNGFVAYRYILQWLVAGCVCFLHLRQLSQSREAGRSRLTLHAGAVAVFALLGIGMQALFQWEASASYDRESFLRGLKPPALALTGAQTEQGFFIEVAKLKDELDRARSEQPGRGWDFGSDGED
ncbi:MAG: FHA domain-containing protein [Burkholderiales bacterium]